MHLLRTCRRHNQWKCDYEGSLSGLSLVVIVGGGHDTSLRNLKPNGVSKVCTIVGGIWCDPVCDIVKESVIIT